MSMISILLIDDEVAILKSVARLLLRLGVDAATVTTRDQALRLVATREFDAIICDCNMPGMSAEEFMLKLELDHPVLERRVIFTSGDLEDCRTRALIERSGHAGLSKPFDAKTVVAAITSITGAVHPAHA